MKITCLSITCRPEWSTWLLHQFYKQTHENKRLIVMDDCLGGWPAPSGPSVTVVPPVKGTLGDKRQALLDQVTGAFCWMDDDDWHPQHRLSVASELLSVVEVVGCRHGLFVDRVTRRTRRLETGDHVVFNGAVFKGDRFAKFQPLSRGEDTAWMPLMVKDARVCSTPEMCHAWIAHDTNVTGKRGSMSFEGPEFKRFDQWELGFLGGGT